MDRQDRTCVEFPAPSRRATFCAIVTLGFINISFSALAPLHAQERADFPVNNTHIVYHQVKTDAQGAIVPWSNDSPSVAYDRNLRAIWSFWKNMRTCPNGVPYYLLHQVWKEREDDPRGLGGDQINMALDSWNLLYGYLGEEDLHANMRMMADYWLTHGMADAKLKYGNLPFPYDLEIASGFYDGDMRAGKGFLQPDKAGSFGFQLVTLYKITEDSHYLDAALKIADTLAATVTPGDAEHSPWPFRANAATGKPAEEVRNSVIYSAAYTTNWMPTLRLFEALISMQKGKTAAYMRAADMVSQWLKEYPLKTNKWGPFFEDIPTADYSDTEINADTLATYLLDHPAFDPNSAKLARAALEWTYTRLGNHEFESLHVVPINEQTKYLVPGNSHTARHASVELMYCEITGDCSTKQDAIRRLNWATYSVNEDGRNRYPNDDIWLTDGYGDYVRHYLRAMAAAPELARDDQNHLLRTTSVIQHITYAPDRITLRKFDARSAEKFKIGAGLPVRVSGGRMRWDPKTRILEVDSDSRDVTVQLQNGGPS